MKSLNLKVDVCMTFDTTGSMYPCFYEVKRQLQKLVEKLFTEGNDVRIAIIAHGDYCDASETYVLKQMDFTTNERKLISFVEDVGPTYGGDAPECYEYALRAANQLSWRKDSRKILILTGDATPHEVNYSLNVERIDWRQEVKKLVKNDVKIYPIHAMPGIRKYSKPFYQSLASLGNGIYLTMDQFAIMPELILAATYAQGEFNSDSEREDTLRQFDTSYCMRNNIRALLGQEEVTYTESAEGLVPIPDGAYQVFEVREDIPIKVFVENAGIQFTKGNGFYELSKTEKVQQYKEIFLQERATGKLFTGSQVREMLGLLPQIEGTRGGTTETIKPTFFKKYKVFIQSTSYNRKLKAGTFFLYKVEEEGLEVTPEHLLAEEIKEEEKAKKKSTKCTKKIEKVTTSDSIAKCTVTKASREKSKVVSKPTTKKYIMTASGKRRLLKIGDVLIAKSSNLTTTVAYKDGKYVGIFRGKEIELNMSAYKAIYTPKLNSKGEPDKRISRYSATDLQTANFAEL